MADLRAIKDEFKLSDEKLAEIMKISRPSVIKTLNGEREMRVTELFRIMEAYHLTIDSINNVKSKMVVDFLEESDELRESRVTGSELRVSVPQENYKKFKNALLYILEKIGAKPNVGQTVLYKILYFSDFDYYEKYEEQLIGARYQKNHFGPTPVEFSKIVTKMHADRELEIVKSDYFGRDQTKYLPISEPDLSVFTAREIKHIDEEIEKLGNMTAAQISDLSHKDVPWITTRDGDIIKYESVFYRTQETSVRDYEEDEISE